MWPERSGQECAAGCAGGGAASDGLVLVRGRLEGTLHPNGYLRLTRERRTPRLRRRAGGLLAALVLLLAALVLLLLAGCSASGPHGSGAPASGAGPADRQYVSFTSYPGWIQRSIPPAKFNFAPWTIISDFGLWPTKTGGIAVGDMGSLANIRPAVSAAHQAGKMIIMAVGEQGQGADFAGGAAPRYRARLIRNIVSYVSKYDFDGVNVDWEEEVPQNRADYVALIKGLRSALNAAFPGRHPYLSADVDVGQIPPGIAAQIAPYVSSINMETFQDSGVSSTLAYTRAGIPASKLLLGIGVSSGYYDSTTARVAAKVRYVEQHGLKGTILWQPGALNTYKTDPRLIPLLQMVHGR